MREFAHIMRERAVRSAAKRVAKESGRDNNSRVAIVTGLPRSEVAKILKSDDRRSSSRLLDNPARKVLTAWYDDSRFLDSDGEPAVLPIFGARRSFERLVASQAKGIPVRAMLDELVEIDSVETLPNQTVRAKSRIPILTGLTSKAVTAIGERTRDLLNTLSYNRRPISGPFFEGTASLESARAESIPLIRREIDAQSASFINSANAMFSRESLIGQAGSDSPATSKYRLGVTVYYFQVEVDRESKNNVEKQVRRKNLRRRGNAHRK